MGAYVYNQNNSGGRFGGPAMYVIVEADNAEDADTLAQEAGVYFNGVDDGYDCECCGDRWYNAYGDPDYETVEDAIERITGNEWNKTAMTKAWAKEAGGLYVVVRGTVPRVKAQIERP